MAQHRMVNRLLDQAGPKAQPKRRAAHWETGLKAIQEHYKVAPETELEEVKNQFIRSRRNGTDGARLRNSEASLKAYADDLRIFFRFLNQRGITTWERITRQDVREFVDHMNHRMETKQLSPASGWKVHRTLRSLFFFIEKQEDFKWESFRKVLPAIPNSPGRQWIPSPEQMKAFMDGFDRETMWGFRDYVMATILLDCGARIGELCNMTTDDVLWDADTIILFGKKRQARKVSLSATRTMPLLRQWDKVRAHYAKCNRFFVTRYGAKLPVNELNKSWRKMRNASGLGLPSEGNETGTITPHTFRHYFCTRFLVNGGKLEVLPQITGHLDLKTLMGYVHLAAELSHVKEEHRRVSPLDSLYGDDTKKKRKMF